MPGLIEKTWALDKEKDLQEPNYYHRILQDLEKETTKQVGAKKAARIFATVIAPYETGIWSQWEHMRGTRKFKELELQESIRSRKVAESATATLNDIKKMTLAVKTLQANTANLGQQRLMMGMQHDRVDQAINLISKFAGEEIIGTNRKNEIVKFVQEQTKMGEQDSGLDLSVMFSPEKDKEGNVKGFSVKDPDFILKKEGKEFKERQLLIKTQLDKMNLALKMLDTKINERKLALQEILGPAALELDLVKTKAALAGITAGKEKREIDMETAKTKLETAKKADPMYTEIMKNASKKDAPKWLKKAAKKMTLEKLGLTEEPKFWDKLWDFLLGKTKEPKLESTMEQIRKAYIKETGKHPDRIYQKMGKWYIEIGGKEIPVEYK